MPEGEEEEQEIENVFEKIMKENFPNSMKEIDNSRKQRVPNKLDPRKHTPRHIIIKLPKIKDKQRILKVAREKETITYKGVPVRNLSGKRRLERSIQSHESQRATSKITLSSKANI